MSGMWGNNIKLSIFGESHGEAIGMVIDGLPSGINLDIEFIKSEMERRAPGKNKLSTSRKEKDKFKIVSGYFNDRTTGTPLCITIPNTNTVSKDYSMIKKFMRPGHADYTGRIKYFGFNDYRGGGHFSGRLTAPLVFAGAVAKQILKEKGIVIGSHIKRIENVEDDSFDWVNVEHKLIGKLRTSDFPVINEESGKKMKEAILTAKEEMDSVGGIIECAAINVPSGVGNPFFESVESRIAHMMFSIPAVKGIEFGRGFDFSTIRGSEGNDQFYLEEEKIKTYTNNNGGILGGISSGMPIIFKVAIKPTPSIGKIQKTVNVESLIEGDIQVKGRHDPCIVQRAVPVIESATALVILDLLMERKSEIWNNYQN